MVLKLAFIRREQIRVTAALVLICISIFLGCNRKVESIELSPKHGQTSDTRGALDGSIDSSIQETISKFRKALRQSNPRLLDTVIGQGGIEVIRNFTSGGSSRGENVRNFYPTPLNFSTLNFPVENETPIQFDSLFPNLISPTSAQLQIYIDDSLGFEFLLDSLTPKPSTNQLIKSIDEALLKHSGKPVPYALVIKSKFFLLIEDGQSIDNIPVGTFAIFTNHRGKWFLSGIFQFL